MAPGRDIYVHKEQPLSGWEAVAELAGRQFGVLSAEQLLGLGLSRRAIARSAAGGRMVHRAEVQKVSDLRAIREVQARVPGRTGRHLLSRVLAAYEPSPRVTRSEGERRLMKICEEHGLALPETQVPVAGYEIDCLWRHAGIAVEFDGREFHDNTRAYYDDRLRDRKLRVADVQTIRVTWRDLVPDPADLVADLRALLY